MYKKFQTDAFSPVKFGLIALAPVSVALFAVFVSSTTANLIAFSALVNSLMFIAFSIWLLG